MIICIHIKTPQILAKIKQQSPSLRMPIESYENSFGRIQQKEIDWKIDKVIVTRRPRKTKM